MSLSSSFPPLPTFLATSMLGLGLYRFAAPRQAYQLFGLPLAAGSSPSPFIYVSAGRDIAIGLTYALLGLQGKRQGLKAFIIGTAVIAQFDAFAVLVYGGAEFGGWGGKWIKHALAGVGLAVLAWKEIGF